MALTSAAPRLLARLPEHFKGSVKPELMQCYVEINSRVCADVAEAEADLREKLGVVEAIGRRRGAAALLVGHAPVLHLAGAAGDRQRPLRLADRQLQDTARQMVTFGLHVHVGVDSGDKAVMICDRMLRHLPTLLAASCNSPFWDGRATGLQSWRARVVEALPTAGLPPLMRNWSEYVWLINHLVADRLHPEHPRDLVGHAPAPQLRHRRGPHLRHPRQPRRRPGPDRPDPVPGGPTCPTRSTKAPTSTTATR